MRQYHNGDHARWTTSNAHGEAAGSVFVFGSNLAGIHGAGAAAYAHKMLGFSYGVGSGPEGPGSQPTAYAIPTKDAQIRTLPLARVALFVAEFVEYARVRPDTMFFVSAIGTGLAGFHHKDIAPLFKDAPNNCIMPPEWRFFLEGP